MAVKSGKLSQVNPVQLDDGTLSAIVILANFD